MSSVTPEAEAGQAVYTKPVLAAYDLLVLGLSNRLIWRCPTRHILDLYDAHVSANHLDVGVGTGFFLDRCRFPSSPRLVLMDLNPNCLGGCRGTDEAIPTGTVSKKCAGADRLG